MKKLHIRCPMCGVRSWHGSIPPGIYTLELWMQEFGGSEPAPGKKRGNKQKGRMVWMRYANPSSDVLSEIVKSIKEKIKMLAQAFGVRIEIDLPRPLASEIVIPKNHVGSEIEVVGASW